MNDYVGVGLEVAGIALVLEEAWSSPLWVQVSLWDPLLYLADACSFFRSPLQ